MIHKFTCIVKSPHLQQHPRDSVAREPFFHFHLQSSCCQQQQMELCPTAKRKTWSLINMRIVAGINKESTPLDCAISEDCAATPNLHVKSEMCCNELPRYVSWRTVSEAYYFGMGLYQESLKIMSAFNDHQPLLWFDPFKKYKIVSNLYTYVSLSFQAQIFKLD